MPEVRERADRQPRRAPGGRVEAGRRLVEEDELGVADEGQREVQAPQLPAGQPPRPLALLAQQAGELDDLVDVARIRVQPRPVLDDLADRDVAVHPAALQHDAHALAHLARPLAGVVARAPRRSRSCARGSPRGSRPSSSFPPRWAPGGRRPRRGRPRSRSPGRPPPLYTTCEGRGRGWPGLAPPVQYACALRVHRHRVEHDAAAGRRHERRLGARGPAAARVHAPARKGRGPARADRRRRGRRGDPGAPRPRGRRRPDPRRRDGRAARRGQPRGAGAARSSAPPASRSRSSAATRRPAWPSRAPRARSATCRSARSASSTSAAARPSSSSGRWPKA